MMKRLLVFIFFCFTGFVHGEEVFPKDVQRLINEYTAADHFSGEINGDKSEL
jgi:hypothetical protein